MQTTKYLSISLPLDLALVVEKKVAAGEYASESDMLSEGLRALQARDSATEAWLRNEVVASCREMTEDPSRGLPLDGLLDRLKATHVSP